MTTPHDQSPQTDPKLDALLDKAVAAGSPPASPDLAQRIIDQTQPILAQRPVLARIGPTLLRVAAGVAIVAGASIAAITLTNDQPTPIDNDNTPLALFESDLQDIERNIEQAIEPGNTHIDQQMDVLSLRVELASSEDAWGAVDQDTNSLMDQAVTRYEVDQFNDDTMYLWADSSALF